MSTAVSLPAVSRQQALAIAEADALPVYRDLNDLTVEVALQDDGWHVDYWLRKPGWAGGGPHYIIDAETGAIVFKKYSQ